MTSIGFKPIHKLLLMAALGAGPATAPLAATIDWEWRTFDGTGNNPNHPDQGAAHTQLIRIAAPAYPGDGSGATIKEDPNPRNTSNAIVAQGAAFLPNERGLSNYLWQWGQFIDHDISLTEGRFENGPLDIPVTDPDDIFYPAGVIRFDRSDAAPGTGTPGNPRQQINQLTAYIDASQVYGSDQARANALRGTGGKLLTSAGNLLPLNTMGLENSTNMMMNPEDFFVAGDIRANEQIGLTAMHTLFMREHNRVVDELVGQGVTGSDALYEMARRIVGAETQVITYEQWLPMLLGPYAPDPSTFAYDPTVDAGIANEFSTALFRFGHTMLPPALSLVENNGRVVGRVPLRDAFLDPGFFREDPSRIDQVLMGLVNDPHQEFDTKIADGVRNFLFGPPEAGGFDLAALNIQRGRDHGLPDYNTLREAYGLDRVVDFSDISTDPAVQAALAELFGDVDNIDPWVGGLAEDRLPGASVGELVAEAIIDQFTRLAEGDRFFYRWDQDLQDYFGVSFSGLRAADTTSINPFTMTLTEVIRTNTSMSNMPDNLFVAGIPAPPVWALGLAGVLAWGLIRPQAKQSTLNG